MAPLRGGGRARGVNYTTHLSERSEHTSQQSAFTEIVPTPPAPPKRRMTEEPTALHDFVNNPPEDEGADGESMRPRKSPRGYQFSAGFVTGLMVGALGMFLLLRWALHP